MAKLLDTSYLIAYHNKDDKHHQRAREIEVENRVINDYIYTEVIDILYSRRGKDKANEYGKFLNKSTKMVRVSKPIFKKAVQNFKDKDISFIDASIAATAQKLDMKLVSFDKDFDQFQDINRIY
jgi:predicted nucleic acid-binding protein